MPSGARVKQLTQRAQARLNVFATRTLAFDQRAASAYAPIVGARRKRGLGSSIADTQIAAIARVHSAVLATRNVKDFEHSGVEVQSPWNS